MDFFNTTFYDKASTDYSDKRYHGAPQSFIQFFFQKRLKHVVDLVGTFTQGKTNLTLIEDGCADGVVAQMVGGKYPETFSKIIGTDISPGMIDRARELNKNERFTFSLKKDLQSDIKADVLLAVGFVSPGIFEDEFSFIREHLAQDGVVIVSVASGDSPYAKLKLKDKEITKDYWTFAKYRMFFEKDFKILASIPYGLFVPKLWAFPKLARMIQPCLEVIFRIFPSLFHETLFMLRQKR